jgi:hypothetical protein
MRLAAVCRVSWRRIRGRPEALTKRSNRSWLVLDDSPTCDGRFGQSLWFMVPEKQLVFVHFNHNASSMKREGTGRFYLSPAARDI